MRIAFVSQPWNSTTQPATRSNLTGGMNLWTYEITRRLSPDDQLVIFGKGTEHEREGNIEYWPINHPREGRVMSRWQAVKQRLQPGDNRHPIFASRFYYGAYILRVALALRSWQPDIIHIHNFPQFASIVRAFNPDARIVLHMHCEWLLQLDKKQLERRLRDVDLVLSTSDYLTERTRRRFPWLANRCRTVHNGVDVEQFVPPTVAPAPVEQVAPSRRRVMFVGRISPEKGIHTLLDAFQQVADRFPDVDLEIVGPVGAAPIEFMAKLSDDPLIRGLTRFYGGPKPVGGDAYFTHLKSLIPASLPDRILWRGKIHHDELLRYYHGATLVVLPSVVHEAFGIPLVEAMASQVPVIGTRSGGIPEVIGDGQAGLIVEREDADGLAAALTRLLEDDDLRQEMALVGRERAVQQFSWDSAALHLQSCYASLFSHTSHSLPTEATPAWSAI